MNLKRESSVLITEPPDGGSQTHKPLHFAPDETGQVYGAPKTKMLLNKLGRQK